MSWLTLATSAIAIIAFADSTLTRFVRSRSKRYAAEQDFEYVKRELEHQNMQLNRIETEIRTLERTVSAIDAIQRLTLARTERNESQ